MFPSVPWPLAGRQEGHRKHLLQLFFKDSLLCHSCVQPGVTINKRSRQYKNCPYAHLSVMSVSLQDGDDAFYTNRLMLSGFQHHGLRDKETGCNTRWTNILGEMGSKADRLWLQQRRRWPRLWRRTVEHLLITDRSLQTAFQCYIEQRAVSIHLSSMSRPIPTVTIIGTAQYPTRCTKCNQPTQWRTAVLTILESPHPRSHRPL